MGGCSGKGSKEGGIPYRMDHLSVPDYNDFFQQCESILKQAEDLRSSIEDNKEKLVNIAKSWQTQDEADYLIEGIQALFIALQANLEDGGDLLEIFSIVDHDPYVTYHTKSYIKISVDHACIALRDYILGVFQAPEKIIALIEKTPDLLTKSEELVKNADSACQGNPFEIAKFVKGAGCNSKTLVDGVQKLKDLKPMAEQAKADLQKIIAEKQNLIDQAKTKGEEAKKSKLVECHQTFDKYSTKARKTPAEIKKEAKKRK